VEGSNESARRNFSFPQTPQIFAEFFNPKRLLNALPDLRSTNNFARSAASLTSERKNEAEL
jgi:hypothetical protein